MHLFGIYLFIEFLCTSFLLNIPVYVQYQLSYTFHIQILAISKSQLR